MTRGNDSTLLAIASKGAVDSYAEVALRLRALDAELDARDGLFWFNRWYSALLTALVENTRRHRFVEPDFVERLECHAADRYFAALAAHLMDPGSGPSCWDPVLQARGRAGVLPVQHAVAGINAHVNHDLPVALVTTFSELGREPARDAPVHADYQRIGALLDGVLCDAPAWLAPRAGDEAQPAAPDAATAHAQLEEALTIWSTERACEAAWVAAEVRWTLRVSPLIAHHYLEALDRLVGLAGRGLLRPWYASPQIERRPSSAPRR
ncbi:MAG TPA: DUF5995 family protein [Polyangiaceae bacterium]|nr:DUF5995 family protein [Polyangiaceae bacterium]